ncbi:MAG: nuclear transport factor 2 family protein [Bryobacteraceae bacterium]
MRGMPFVLGLVLVGLSLSGVPVNSKSVDESAAIKQTALDYLEGWYECNPERMEQAVHPDLAKRIVIKDVQTRRDRLDEMSALTIVQVTRGDCGGRKTPKESQRKEITILDTYEDMASVKVVFTGWVDYLHMTKFNGRWVIVNVLWHRKPKTEQK